MKNLKNKGLKIVESKIQSFKSWRMLLVLMLILAFAAAPAQLVRADSGGERSHTFNVTFTKWITSEPANPPSVAGVSMAGVVGGDVGDGLYAGKVLSDDLSVPGFWLGHARYEFYGKKHSFIADVHIVEDDTTDPATAVVTGVITDGWLKGANVTGTYTVIPVCPIATPGNVFGTVCIPGTLRINPEHGENGDH